ncbi:NAD-dependent epimerase/dehydratase family protein [Reinekea forsetii]|uniref:UDP-glucose 4-epimerase n=1 Tax=Reinekea forsetii TaxID=1336806 RepID=A0A2K8KRC7_9GAMM|nr:NAD-dependent epimerase/dehydratase family protein [Reinekea forsetii]ATX76639.1 UDP-glucose 4-epimerase [Reinekea forsetii]
MIDVLITGGTGFIGQSLAKKLIGDSKYNLRFFSRRSVGLPNEFFGDISNVQSIKKALSGVEVVIHLAALTPDLKKKTNKNSDGFHKINHQGVRNLAQCAAEAGVKRFIFLSSIKVNGESTENRAPFLPFQADPKDMYGQSKFEAEQLLFDLAVETQMEIVIIRPPLVYGEGVKGNFASLVEVVRRGIPLPFGLLHSNRRSMVSVYNLVDLIINCISNSRAASQIFLVSDDEDLSTAGLLVHLASAMGKRLWLLPVPIWLFLIIGKLTGRSSMVDRLVGSLQVDIQHTKDLLDWEPPFSVSESIKLTLESTFADKE